MIDAFLVSKAVRFDVKGKKYIGSPVKYYFEDVGLRNARLNFRQSEENHIMENIIYNELRIRGYNVDVGVVECPTVSDNGKRGKRQLEIDFVATRGSENIIYNPHFPWLTTKSGAGAPLTEQHSGFIQKIVIVRDNIKTRRDETGIVTLGLINFLMDENSLMA